MQKYILFVGSCVMMYAVYLCPESYAAELPEELKHMVNMSVEDDTTHCMEQLRNCLNPHTDAPVCSINAVSDEKQAFESICEMIHENCRTKKEQWHFLSDDLHVCNETGKVPKILRKVRITLR